MAALQTQGGEQVLMKLEPDRMTRVDPRLVDPVPLPLVDPIERGTEPFRVAREARQGLGQLIADRTQAPGQAAFSSHRHSL